jgi:hypothetical protein
MSEEAMDTLLEAIRAVVSANGPWAEKASALAAHAKADSSSEANLEEFLSWYGGAVEP